MKSTVIVVGGGLAGLTVSLELARSGLDVMVIEKRNYPSHRVCGEYVSNEVRPFLERLGLPLAALGAVPISRLAVSSPDGTFLESPLESGGFGISRYRLDHALYQLCREAGVTFRLTTSVTQVKKEAVDYSVRTSDGDAHTAQVVIGAFGKKSNLDVKLSRSFTKRSSPYLAVKYHIRTPHPDELISIHNFADGYCGMSAVEEGKSCLCYLTTRANLKNAGNNIAQLERTILSRNPYLRRIFEQAEFLYEKPLVINEVSFAAKTQYESGLLMAGDAAGMIAPLCGNGMAMAIHSAHLLAGLVTAHFSGQYSVVELERRYQEKWRRMFGLRLAAGRTIQAMFGNAWLTNLMVGTLRHSPALTRRIIRLTHGAVLE